MLVITGKQQISFLICYITASGVHMLVITGKQQISFLICYITASTVFLICYIYNRVRTELSPMSCHSFYSLPHLLQLQRSNNSAFSIVISQLLQCSSSTSYNMVTSDLLAPLLYQNFYSLPYLLQLQQRNNIFFSPVISQLLRSSLSATVITGKQQISFFLLCHSFKKYSSLAIQLKAVQTLKHMYLYVYHRATGAVLNTHVAGGNSGVDYTQHYTCPVLCELQDWCRHSQGLYSSRQK